MSRKPLRVDWEPLEEAFSSRNEDEVYYLDLVTGHVVLEGEGSEEIVGEDDEGYTPSVPLPPRRDDAMRLYIHPPTTEMKVEWLEEFLPTVEKDEPEMVAALRDAIPGDNPAPRLSAVLNDHPEGRDRWYMFRTVKVQELIERWLKENDVPILDPPPWR